MKSILVQCWRAHWPKMNLGEWFIELILNHLGYAVRYSPEDRREDDEPVLMVIGSDFTSRFINEQMAELGCAPREIHVWGAGNGIGPEQAIDVRNDPRIKVHAVRGPLTAEWSHIEGVPCCDPGFLLPQILPLKRKPTGEVLWVPHWVDRFDSLPPKQVNGVTDKISVILDRAQVVPTIQRIVNAERVVTNTLHTYILCLAYGVPVMHTYTMLPTKWYDVFASLPVGPNLDAFLEAFPHFLARD